MVVIYIFKNYMKMNTVFIAMLFYNNFNKFFLFNFFYFCLLVFFFTGFFAVDFLVEVVFFVVDFVVLLVDVRLLVVFPDVDFGFVDLVGLDVFFGAVVFFVAVFFATLSPFI